MSRSLVAAGLIGTLAVAAGLAWWALSDASPTTGAPSSRDPAGAAADAAPRTGTATPTASSAQRTRAGRSGATDQDDGAAVAGIVTGTDGLPLPGAVVTCCALPDDAPDDQTRRAREVLKGVADDDEIEALLTQFGARADGEPSPDRAQRAMRAGQRLGVRLLSDPGAMARISRIGRDVAAGLETDADLAVAGVVTTDSTGAFRFDGLSQRRVELRVAAKRHQRRKLRAKAGDVALKVALDAAGSVAGVVRCAGEPVEGAQVTFRSRTVRTGPDGRFAHDAARPPKEPVVVTAPGCVSRAVWAPVEAGKDPEPLVIDLEAAGRVSGRVTAVDGSPIAGAAITLAPDSGAMMRMFMPGAGGADTIPSNPPETTSGDDGTYVLDGVPARSSKLRADRDGFLGVTSASVKVLARGVVESVDFVLAREAVLEGRVTSAGAPLAGADVAVEVPAEGMAKMAAQFMGGISRSSKTGPDGSFRVGGLTPGSRGVTVTLEGYRRRKETITLPAESTTQHDFALEPGFRVAGRVVDPAGAGVPGSTVRVTAQGGDRPANPMAAMLGGDQRTAVTDIAGDFVLTGLDDGPYDLTAAAPGYLEGALRGVAPGTETAVVTLGAAATIRGVVLSAEGELPVANAVVQRKGKSSRAGGNPFLAMLARDPSVSTREDGTFELTGLAPGPYEVWAKAPGYADSVKVKVDAAAGATTEGLRLVLPPGAALTGRVIRKSNGSGVEGAVVWVREEGASPFQGTSPAEILGESPTAPAGSVNAHTDANGAFELAGLTPGHVTLEVRGAGFAPRTIARTEVPSSSVVVDLSEGGALEGTVYDAGGTPSEGQTVIIQQGMMGAGFVRTVTSGREGRYRIEKIPPGSYSALYLDTESPMGMGGMASVSIRDGETTRHDFGKRAAGAPVEGTVMADGKPVDGATVMLLGGTAGMKVAQSDAQGRFRFDHVDAGDYQVMVQSGAMGGGSQSAKVAVGADGQVATVALELSTLALEGSVVDAESGAGVPFAQVVLLTPGGGGASFSDIVARQKGQAITGQDGRFRIEGVPKGSYSLKVSASGWAEAEIEGVSAGGPAVRVALSRGLELVVTVLGPDAKPVTGATVVPEDASGREGLSIDITMSKTTGADGVARLRMQPGRYTIHARATGFPVGSAVVEASSGTLTIRLEAGGSLDVVVKGPAGAALPGAIVKVLDASGAEIREALTISNFLGSGGVTDQDGRARRDGLLPGKVTVVVRTPDARESRREATIAAGQTTRVEVVVE